MMVRKVGRGTKVTHQDRQDIKKAYLDGMSGEALAKKYDIARGTVYYHLAKVDATSKVDKIVVRIKRKQNQKLISMEVIDKMTYSETVKNIRESVGHSKLDNIGNKLSQLPARMSREKCILVYGERLKKVFEDIS